MKLLWTAKALERLEEIARYIAMDSPAAAKRWAEAIVRKADRLREFPDSGRMVPEKRKKEFREIVTGNYRIIYKTGRAAVHILTIRHSEQILPVQELE